MSWIILLTGFVSGFIVAVVVVKRVTIIMPIKTVQERDCKTCTSHRTMSCPNHGLCLETMDKPYYTNKPHVEFKSQHKWFLPEEIAPEDYCNPNVPKKITVPEEDKWCGNCKYDNAMACINCGCGGSPVCSGWVSYLSTEVPEGEKL